MESLIFANAFECVCQRMYPLVHVCSNDSNISVEIKPQDIIRIEKKHYPFLNA